MATSMRGHFTSFLTFKVITVVDFLTVNILAVTTDQELNWTSHMNLFARTVDFVLYSVSNLFLEASYSFPNICGISQEFSSSSRGQLQQ